MSADVEGSCNCGAIKMILKGGYGEKKAWLCHCLNCKKSGGCLSSLVVALPVENVVYAFGNPRVYKQMDTDSGTTLLRYFCADCGSPTASQPEGATITFVKCALFDSSPPLQGEVYWKNAQEWEKPMASEDQVHASG